MIPASQLAQWVQLANISQYLSEDDNAKQSIMQWGPYRGNIRLPFLLGFYADIVNWASIPYVGTEPLDIVATYMYTLMGKYLAQASSILGNATGTVIAPGTPASGSIIKASFDQFTVGQAGALMNAGDISLQLNYPKAQANTVTVEINNVPLTYGALTDQLSYTVVYNATNFVVTIYNGSPNEGVQDGWLIAIRSLYQQTV